MSRARDLAAFVSNADGDIKFDTDTLFIDSSENRVGIGTQTPDHSLSISSASTTQAELKSTATNGTAQLRYTNDARTYTQGVDNNDKFFIYDATGAANRLTIDTSGMVGIGNTSPPEFLTIGDATADGASRIQFFSTTNGVNTIHFGDGASAAAYRGYIQYAHSNDSLVFGTSAADRVRIDSDGLKFGSDSAAANALSDYEEGTWTPVVQGGTSAGTYTTQYILGRYTKIGARVLAETTIYVTGFNGTGDFAIYGLPFNCKSSNPGGLVSAQWNACPFATYSSDKQHVMGLIPANQSYIHFRASSRVANGTHVQLQCGPSTISYMRLTICYEAA